MDKIDFHNRLTLLRCNRARFVLNKDIFYNSNLFFRDVYIYKYIAEHECTKLYPEIYSMSSIDANIIEDLNNKQYILTSFHIGSYFSIIALLLNYVEKLCVVVDSNTYRYRINEFNNYKLSSSVSKILINIESFNGFRLLVKAISMGYTVLFYADGNTGLNGVIDTSNNLEISFFNTRIKVKTGIAYLSQRYNLPIRQILTFKDELMHNKYILSKTILPNKQQSSSTYIKKTISYLWNNFLELLIKKPTQWEGWFYLHRFHIDFGHSLDLQVNDKSKLTISPFCEFYTKNDDMYIYNLKNDCRLHLSDSLFALLIKLKSENRYISVSRISLFIPDKNIIDVLLREEILIYL